MLTKYLKNLNRKFVVSLLIASLTIGVVGCGAKTGEGDAASEESVETAVAQSVEYELTAEDEQKIDDLLKRIEVAVLNSDIAGFSKEFKLYQSDYTDEQIKDINTRLLAFVEQKHDIYFSEIKDKNYNDDNNIEVIVKMGYKNMTDKADTHEFVRMVLSINEDLSYYVSRLYFLNDDEKAQYE